MMVVPALSCWPYRSNKCSEERCQLKLPCFVWDVCRIARLLLSGSRSVTGNGCIQLCFRGSVSRQLFSNCKSFLSAGGGARWLLQARPWPQAHLPLRPDALQRGAADGGVCNSHTGKALLQLLPTRASLSSFTQQGWTGIEIAQSISWSYSWQHSTSEFITEL